MIRATSHLNLQRNIVARQVARKMLPVLLGLIRGLMRTRLFVWLTRSVNHSMPWPKIFIPGFVMVNRVAVTWFTIVEDRPQSTLG